MWHKPLCSHRVRRTFPHTQSFSQCCGSSVQHEESPKHCTHVKDNVTQKRTRGHSKRFDQGNAACNHSCNKYSRSCGERLRIIYLCWFTYSNDSCIYCPHVYVWVSETYQIRRPQQVQQCVGERRLPQHWRDQELRYQEPEKWHPEH